MSPRMTKKFNAKFSYSTRQSHESIHALERKFAIQRISINFFSALSPPSSSSFSSSSFLLLLHSRRQNFHECCMSVDTTPLKVSKRLTLTCPPGLWRSNLTNDREPPNAGFTRFPSGSRLFRIHCVNLQSLSTIYTT